ncbi:MAG: SemiSWEET transporter [Alphaproteobacteria bacterium]|jgi:MtN3 and saliva related transmembrane protein
MSLYEIVGLVAAFLTTASFLPQVAHVWRLGSARDISALWLVMFGAGIALWFVYGLAIAALPVILANAITFLLLLVIAWIKFASRRPV